MSSRGGTSNDEASLTGVGLGLRWELLPEILAASAEELAALRFLEVAPENYMRRGGYFPRALARVAEIRPITTHGLTMSLAGSDAFDGAYFAELRSFLAVFGPGWHSDHLSFSSMDGTQLHDLLPPAITPGNAKRIAARIREAAERLERPLAIENISYYSTLGMNPASEPEFIAEILEEADCGLLLDINNLDVNARNHGFDAETWLDAIPLERVREIHVAGPELWPCGLLIDTHGAPVRESVLRLLTSVLSRTGPKPVLLERDNNVPRLRELLDEVAVVDAVYSSAIAGWRMGGSAHAA